MILQVDLEAAARRAVELAHRLNTMPLEQRNDTVAAMRAVVRQFQQLAEDLADIERGVLRGGTYAVDD